MAVSVPNQWASTFVQPASFGTTPPALQSLVIPLNNSTSVGGGSGTPAAGNWLVCMVSMNEQATTSGFTVAVADDIHSFWRPGNVTTSTWAVSTGTALTRTSIWYTANTSLAAGNVYIAPNGAFDAFAALVLEVSGLGPWDTVKGISTAYSAAATSLNLALGAPGATVAAFAAVTGDSTTAGQAFAPGGWTTLHTTSVTNGADHTCDAVLTAAYLPSTSSSISVNGTASSATDLSGAVIEFQVNASSPIPATQNPNWPYLKFEAAFGAGFQTPPDQCTWTDLSSRAWSWDETTGIQFQLGQVQASNVDAELDNNDGYMSTDNASSPYYPDLVTGTPMRIRAAAGTIGGQTANRWYVIARNAQEWPQQLTGIRRRYVPVTGTDIWSAMSSSSLTPYRGEIYQDAPYAWWPMDDQPLAGGVLPTSLLNAARGNANTLSVLQSPSVASERWYTVDNHAPVNIANGTNNPVVPVYTIAANQGWMYGDPESSPASYSTGSPVTANPGSASWQQSGQAGNSGSQGWFLSCNDGSFPGLSGGVTAEIWFNYQFFGTSQGVSVTGGGANRSLCGQPYAPLTILALYTGSLPVCLLQLNTTTGNLNFITYNSSTPTTHSVYTTSDLRSGSWQHVAVAMTTSAWTVYVNGGLTAKVSGSGAGMTSAWTYLLVNGDMGVNGGGSTSNVENGGNGSFAHAAIYPSQLPAWRILAHYCAAVTGFGLIPAPQEVSVTLTTNEGVVSAPTTFTQDGSIQTGSFGGAGPTDTAVTMSARVAAVAGSYTSGPSAWVLGGAFDYDLFAWVSWNGVAPLFNVYTAATVGSETEASTAAGSGDSYSSGFGGSASGAGRCHVSGGSGASPPAAASALGDTAAQRIERILSYANVTYPGRCIDPAALAVQAGTDIGGQQAAQNITNIAQSDGGLLFVDSLGNLTYWQKSHLAAQYSSPVWTLGPAASGATIPYYQDFRWTGDPQRVWNAITVTPFSPDGASLPVITPASASSVAASQQQYGAQPLPITSYLQSTSEMQSQANWLLANFGQLQIRVDNVKVDAAPYPAAWLLVLGASVGDVVSVQNWQVGGGGTTGTFRISSLDRKISFAGDNGEVEGSLTLTLDYEPSSYWS